MLLLFLQQLWLCDLSSTMLRTVAGKLTFFEMRGNMKLSKAAFALMVAVLVAIPLKSFAADYYVDITNKTGYTIFYMYVSPDKSDSWEEDVLGDDVLSNGETQRVNLNGYKSPIFDIRLVDEDDDSYTFWDVDVSERDITVTLGDIDD
jgi:hypothetical protein